MADIINKPDHYNINWKGDPAIETYEYIKSWAMDYDEGNVIKYLTRYKQKGGLEDLKKGQWYMNKIVEREALRAAKENK